MILDSINSPLVSILVPLYNHDKYINECLDSLKKQTYKNIEVIVINDGSTDNSDVIIKKWIRNNPNVNINYGSQKNIGVTKTLNKMIKISEGEYIALCASDDVLLNDSIQLRIKYLKENENYMAVIGDANVIGADSEFIRESAMKSLYHANYKRLKENITDELVLNWSVVGPTFLCRKSLYSEVGMYDESLTVEDREFYLRLLSKKILCFMPKTVAKYRVHDTNISRKNKQSRFSIYKQVSISNLKHANSFSKINKLFLKSHIIDLAITNKKYSIYSFFLVRAIRAIRAIISKLYLNII